MKQDQFEKLTSHAAKAKRLSDTINGLDSLWRHYQAISNEKLSGEPKCTISLRDGDKHRSNGVYIEIPQEMLAKKLIPIIRETLDELRAELRAMPILPDGV